MIYTLPRLLYVRIVGIERPAMSAHGQAGTLADAIGMQLIATSIYLSAYRLVLRVSLRCVAASHKRPQYTNNSYSDSSWWNNCENTRYQAPIPGTCEERFMVFRRTAEVTCSVNNRGSLSSSSHSGIDRHSSLPSKPSTIECRHHLPVEPFDHRISIDSTVSFQQS